jgi:hypothetical protein
LSDLVDLIPPVEVRLEPVHNDVVHQRRVEQHARADAHRRALGVDGDPHHHAALLFLALHRPRDAKAAAPPPPLPPIFS